MSDPNTNFDNGQLKILGDILLYNHGWLDSILLDNFVRKYFNSCDKNEGYGETKLEYWLRDLKNDTPDQGKKKESIRCYVKLPRS